MKIAIATICLLALIGCAVDPKRTGPTDNEKLSVDELGAYKGCVFYRISDGGNFIHFMRCGVEAQTSESQYCGKGCQYEEVK